VPGEPATPDFFDYIGEGNEPGPLSPAAFVLQLHRRDPLVAPDIRQPVPIQLIQCLGIHLPGPIGNEDSFEYAQVRLDLRKLVIGGVVAGGRPGPPWPQPRRDVGMAGQNGVGS
jgi:hypothetical protein